MDGKSMTFLVNASATLLSIAYNIESHNDRYVN